MAALARTVLTTTLLAFTAVRPFAVLTNTLILISMFSCVFFGCAYDGAGVSLPSLPPWLAVDPKVVDIQFQAFATVCCAVAGTLLLTTVVYFSVFPAEAKRVLTERGDSWWWPERHTDGRADPEDTKTIWSTMSAFAALSGWNGATAFRRARSVGFGDPEKPEREALAAFFWMGTCSFGVFVLLAGVVVRISTVRRRRPGDEAAQDLKFTSTI